MTVIHSKRDPLYLFKCRCYDNLMGRQFELFIWHDNWSTVSLSKVLMDAGTFRCVVLNAHAVDPSVLRQEVAA